MLGIPERLEVGQSGYDVTNPVERAVDGSKGLEEGDKGSRDHALMDLEVVHEVVEETCESGTISRVHVNSEDHNVPKYSYV